MKFLLIDDDDKVRKDLSDFLVENGYEINTYHFENTEDSENIVRKTIQKLKKEDYILMDLYLDEQAERTISFQQIKSVKLLSGLKFPNDHIIFYSNGNVREIDPLFDAVKGCRFLPIRGVAFDKGDIEIYGRYDRKRKDFLSQIKNFIGD